jgi:hypothetical protein
MKMNANNQSNNKRGLIHDFYCPAAWMTESPANNMRNMRNMRVQKK